MPDSQEVEIRFSFNQESIDRVHMTMEAMDAGLVRLAELQDRIIANSEKLADLGGFGGFSG